VKFRTELFLAWAVWATATANAQTIRVTPPDGPLQGLIRSDVLSAHKFRQVFDIDHDGRVTRNELERADAIQFAVLSHKSGVVTKSVFIAAQTAGIKSHAAQIFRRLDWNGDGRLSFDEYAGPLRVRFEAMEDSATGAELCDQSEFAARPRRMENNGRQARVSGRALFCERNDADRDGKVTRAEFEKTLARQFSIATKGSKTMLEAEFVAAILDQSHARCEKAFDRIDTNRDGKLSLKEFVEDDQTLFTRFDRNRDGALTQADDAVRRYGQAAKAHSAVSG
jgi:Ca2+-binding EF-hand superfamily protein